MNVLAVYGSPRKDGNSSTMLNEALSEFSKETEIHKLYLSEMNISGCGACRKCVETGLCEIQDEMQQIYKELRWAQIIFIATPTLFSDVSSDLKKMMERTWCIRGTLKNKIGGYVISGRRYIENTANTLHAFMLRHKMILGGSGALGFSLTEMGTLENDPLAIVDSHKTAKRLIDIYQLIYER